MTNDERCRERAAYLTELGKLELQSKLLWILYRAKASTYARKTRIGIDCPRYKADTDL